MAKKIYKSTTGVEYMFHVPVDGKEIAVWTRESGTTFSTSDKKLQEAIEQHEYFKKKLLVISRVVDVPNEVVEDPKAPETPGDIKSDKVSKNVDPVIPEVPKADTDKKLNEYPKVKNMGDAVDVLRGEPYFIPETDLLLKKQVLEKAKELGIKFPNYR
jgi:hypothetical protein